MRFVRGWRWPALAGALVWLAPIPGRAQGPTTAPSRDPRPAELVQPKLHARRELVLAGLGAGMLITGALIPTDERPIPPQGLDASEISWGVDRRSVGHRSLSANTASNWTRNSALVFPIVLVALINKPGRNLFSGFWARSTEYMETLLVSQGPTLLGKSLIGRARPYAYLPVDERPDDRAYDVTRSGTFASMPSGHSSSAWTGAALGMTEELLSRPGASWLERVGIGLVGGGLAGATSALRVQAGQHFPSDVIAGAGIGIATGVAVPLLHRDGRPMPSDKAWLEMVGGALVGTVVGVAVTR